MRHLILWLSYGSRHHPALPSPPSLDQVLVVSHQHSPVSLKVLASWVKEGRFCPRTYGSFPFFPAVRFMNLMAHSLTSPKPVKYFEAKLVASSPVLVKREETFIGYEEEDVSHIFVEEQLIIKSHIDRIYLYSACNWLSSSEKHI